MKVAVAPGSASAGGEVLYVLIFCFYCSCTILYCSSCYYLYVGTSALYVTIYYTLLLVWLLVVGIEVGEDIGVW